ncbi:hypothetical protein N7474_000808 [Penicillium riverlandense]|uniref:uncharacterized protein n=1 Tax=Penicillium riverlandense TaxID=1903569 RepID=UPI0025495078|nr:uncharacterized protein N7474_000808 [Penicillium riverlandense]KAJ5832497.1 hypothetical protein N7474_000808 [Penicillium riverlandense]
MKPAIFFPFAATPLTYICRGLLLAFGVFQTYYQEELLPGESSSSLAWISTTSAFILLASGLVTGPLFDCGYLRPLLVTGSLLEVFGLMMLSVSTQYYQVLLSQGICVGLGAGMIFVPSLSAVAVCLEDARRAKIIGLLVTTAGFPWAIRTIAFLIVATFVFSSPVLGVYRSSRSPMVRAWIYISAFTDKAFVSILCGAVFSATVFYLPMLYLPLFGTTTGGIRNANLAFYLVSIANGASVFGRLLCGLLATAIGPIETCGLAVASSAIVLFCWLAVVSPVGLIIWSIAWGFISNAIVAMPGAIVPCLAPSVNMIGTRTGMLWTAVAIGMLIGSPIAGALIEYGDGNIKWWRVQLFAGLCMAISSFFFVYPTVYVRRKKSGL